MRFLCPTHKTQLLAQSFDQLGAHWLDWMMRAAVFYPQHSWREALPFVGCGFELSCHLIEKDQADIPSAAIKLSLSAIYLHNLFQHLSDPLNAQKVLHEAVARLLECIPESLYSMQQELIGMLLNTMAHGQFFNRYLNLPFKSSAVSSLVRH